MTDAKKPARPTKSAKETKKDNKMMTGVAVGVGSAALVAALLYARSTTKKKKD